MKCVIYARSNPRVSVFEQHNLCARYASRYGYSIEHRVFDTRGDRFHEAVNKVVASEQIQAMLVYDKSIAFDSNDDYLFYQIYFKKLDKSLLVVE